MGQMRSNCEMNRETVAKTQIKRANQNNIKTTFENGVCMRLCVHHQPIQKIDLSKIVGCLAIMLGAWVRIDLET